MKGRIPEEHMLELVGRLLRHGSYGHALKLLKGLKCEQAKEILEHGITYAIGKIPRTAAKLYVDYLAFESRAEKYHLLNLAVNAGSIDAMLVLANDYGLTWSERAVMLARALLYENVLGNRLCKLDARYPILIGRELEGCEEIWMFEPDLYIKGFINDYKNATHKARRAALYSVFAFRKILWRDVSLIIGKMVYETRTENVWIS